MRRVLVTGATGFCGPHLCRYLVKKGYQVTGTYLHPSKDLSAESRFNLIKLDISNFSQVVSVIQELKPEAVFHLAAMSVPSLSWKREKETFEINVGGTLYLLEALRRFSPRTRFLFASSIQVYGRSFRAGRAVKETDLAWPESPYAVSKLIAEHACLNYFSQFGLPVVIARAFNHLGRGQSLHFVFSDWCRQVALAEKRKRKPVLEVGNLDAYRDFLHVEDVVAAYEVLARRARAGGIYNVCQGRARQLEDYVQFMLRKALVRMKVRVQKKRLRRYDPPVMKGDVSRLRALGWRPRLSPLTALEELLNEWRAKV